MLNLSDYRVGLNSPHELGSICEELAPKLQFSYGLDKASFLMAIAGVESSFAKNNKPRFEEAYGPQGIYFKNQTIQELYRLYGPLASCSYGPWQILAVKAHEFGFRGHPLELWDGHISGPFVIMLLNKIHADGAKEAPQALDAYNTGSFRKGEPPKEYIAKFWSFYGEIIEEKLKEKENV